MSQTLDTPWEFVATGLDFEPETGGHKAAPASFVFKGMAPAGGSGGGVPVPDEETNVGEVGSLLLMVAGAEIMIFRGVNVTVKEVVPLGARTRGRLGTAVRQTFDAVVTKGHPAGMPIRPCIWTMPILHEGNDLAFDIKKVVWYPAGPGAAFTNPVSLNMDYLAPRCTAKAPAVKPPEPPSPSSQRHSY